MKKYIALVVLAFIISIISLPTFSLAQTLNPKVSALGCVDLKTDLRLTSRGADVSLLQRYLNANDLLVLPKGPTGYFGTDTVNAVKELQKLQQKAGAQKITPTGYVGSATRAYIKAETCPKPPTPPVTTTVCTYTAPTFIHLKFPNGGAQAFIAGDKFTASWDSCHIANNALINITASSASASFTKLLTPNGTPNVKATLGTFVADTTGWPAGDDYKITVEWKGDDGKIYKDDSDAFFSIRLPKILITAPNGGEAYSTGDTIPITWKVENIDSDQSVAFFLIGKFQTTGGSIDEAVVEGYKVGTTVGKGKVDFKIPLSLNGALFGKNFKIHAIVSSPTGGLPHISNDSSDDYFTIKSGSSTTLPAGCKATTGYSETTGLPCSSQTILSSLNAVRVQSEIYRDLNGGVGFSSQGIEKLPAVGCFTPNSMLLYPEIAGAISYISGNTGGAQTCVLGGLNGQRPLRWSVSTPLETGEKWCADSAGYLGVGTDLDKDGDCEVATPKYPPGCTSSQGYSPITGEKCDGSGPKPPTTCPTTSAPSITVLSPNGGGKYKPGQQIEVKWDVCNLPDKEVTIGLVFLDATKKIAKSLIKSPNNHTPNDGFEIVTLPLASEFPDPDNGRALQGNFFKVYVSTDRSAPLDCDGIKRCDYSNVQDYSDNNFAIGEELTNPATITIISPNGGERYSVGQSIEVKWDSKYISKDEKVGIHILYITPSGNSWHNLLTASTGYLTPNDGSEFVNLLNERDFPLFISPTPVSGFEMKRFKIVVGSEKQLCDVLGKCFSSLTEDISNDTFTISSAVSYPDGCTSSQGYSSTTGQPCDPKPPVPGFPSVRVMTPNGGESYALSAPTSGVSTLPVKMEVHSSKVGTLSTYIVQNPSVQNPGTKQSLGASGGYRPDLAPINSFSINLTEGLSFSPGNYYLMVEWRSFDGSENLVDFSDASFAIRSPDSPLQSCSATQVPSVKMLSPDNGSETFYSGGNLVVRWKTSNVPLNPSTGLAMTDDRVVGWSVISFFGAAPVLNYAKLVSSSGTENTYEYSYKIPDNFNGTLPVQFKDIFGGQHYKASISIVLDCYLAGTTQRIIRDDSDNLFAINSTPTLYPKEIISALKYALIQSNSYYNSHGGYSTDNISSFPVMGCSTQGSVFTDGAMQNALNLVTEHTGKTPICVLGGYSGGKAEYWSTSTTLPTGKKVCGDSFGHYWAGEDADRNGICDTALPTSNPPTPSPATVKVSINKSEVLWQSPFIVSWTSTNTDSCTYYGSPMRLQSDGSLLGTKPIDLSGSIELIGSLYSGQLYDQAVYSPTLLVGVQCHDKYTGQYVNSEINMNIKEPRTVVYPEDLPVKPGDKLVMFWEGKVNNFLNPEGKWQTEPDGYARSSGADVDKLTYCKMHFPNTKSVVKYSMETTNTWYREGNIPPAYESRNMAYKCVQTERVGFWWGKYNVSVNTNTGKWESDPTRSYGANMDYLAYCKVVYPNTIAIEKSVIESIDVWRDALGGGPYPSVAQTYNCVQGGVTGGGWSGGVGLAPSTKGAVLGAEITSVACVDLNHDLLPNAQSKEVSLLQKALNNFGLLNAEPTGFYGRKTELAVRNLQIANNIRNTGEVGSLTRELIRIKTCPN